MTAGKFYLVEKIQCAECGCIVFAQHRGGGHYAVKCVSNPECPQHEKEFAYEQPVLELKPCEVQA